MAPLSDEYERALEYLYGLQVHGIKFGLSSTKSLLKRLGNPHKRLSVIHIAGTNGKGSVAATVASILKELRLKVGLYTSPHLVRFNERLVVNSREISDKKVVGLFNQVREVVDDREPPTYFEIVTAMALKYFADQKVDWAVVEVGMGGRLDATNVVNSTVCAITTIGLEHKEYLGSTLAAIAREKAGIIKAGVPVVTGVKKPKPLAVIKTRSQMVGAPLMMQGIDFRSVPRKGGTLDYFGSGVDFRGLNLALKGRHQRFNAGLALGVLENLWLRGLISLNETAVHRGLLAVTWPGRLEMVMKKPPMILDGAHNPDAAAALKNAVTSEFPHRRLITVLGVMSDKDGRGIVKRIASISHRLILTRTAYERGMNPEKLLEHLADFNGEAEAISDLGEALARAMKLAKEGDLILVTGSLYLVGEVKEILAKQGLI